MSHRGRGPVLLDLAGIGIDSGLVPAVITAKAFLVSFSEVVAVLPRISTKLTVLGNLLAYDSEASYFDDGRHFH